MLKILNFSPPRPLHNSHSSQFATASYDSSISIWTTDPEDADEAVSGDDATTDSNTSRKKRRVDQKIKVKVSN